MLHLLWEAIIGLIVGALAKLIMPGKDPGGIIITMLLGIAGALLAGWLGSVIGWYKEGQSAGFIASLIGESMRGAPYSSGPSHLVHPADSLRGRLKQPSLT